MAAPRKRGNPTAKVGNYAAPVDTAGLSDEEKDTLTGSQSGYVKPQGTLGKVMDFLTRPRKPKAKK
jgi:hypothetical protein